MLFRMSFRAFFIALSFVSAGKAVSAQNVTGAGASFPAPLYMQWADQYYKETKAQINYQSFGSSAGVRQIKAQTVNFGASDAPLSQEELDRNGLVQFPVVIGGIIPVVNLPGIQAGEMRLSGPVLADIFLGKIRQWNDPAIEALNPDIKLPAQPITVILRSDGSGTTNTFTDYLAKISDEWKRKIGSGNAVRWPAEIVGHSTSGKGNAGVATVIAGNSGSIGYVEYAYAKQNNISYIRLQNREGNFVIPEEDSFKAAAEGIDWSRSFGQSLNDASGENAWPITTATFIIIHRQPGRVKEAAEALRFFDWAFRKGDQTALDLNYVPFPDSVKQIIRASWKNITDPSGKPLFTE